MAKVIGFDESVYKKFICRNCAAIVQYSLSEVIWNKQTDEGEKIIGLYCPNCRQWHRTNP